jgi:prolyl 4-hydroxylase
MEIIIVRMLAFFLLLQSHTVSSELFTALADMESLVSTESELVRHLDNYIQDEEIRLKQLRR